MPRGRRKNDIPSVKFEITTTEAVLEQLRRVVQTGFYGKNTAEAAEQIMRQSLYQKLGGDEAALGNLGRPGARRRAQASPRK